MNLPRMTLPPIAPVRQALPPDRLEDVGGEVRPWPFDPAGTLRWEGMPQEE